MPGAPAIGRAVHVWLLEAGIAQEIGLLLSRQCKFQIKTYGSQEQGHYYHYDRKVSLLHLIIFTRVQSFPVSTISKPEE